MVGKKAKRPAPAEQTAQEELRIELRTEYRRILEAYTADMVAMCELARCAMLHASRAIMSQDLEAAENAMTESDKFAEIHQRCEERALLLLARQSPVASELRQVLAYIHMERDITRMGNLAKLIAKTARQHHPNPAFPDEILATVGEMADACDHMAAAAEHLIAEPDADAAASLASQDEAVDTASRGLSARAASDGWPYSNRAAVESALIARYYERFADHCVSVGRHIVFMVTGERAEDGAGFGALA